MFKKSLSALRYRRSAIDIALAIINIIGLRAGLLVDRNYCLRIPKQLVYADAN